MKRIIIALLLAIVVMMTVGTSMALAKGPPETIKVNVGTGLPPVFDKSDNNDPGPPPDITIHFPDGRTLTPGPPDGRGPGSGY